MNKLMMCAVVGIVGLWCGIASADVELQGGGATFPDPVYQVWIKAYTQAHTDVKITYTAKGSGFGISSIIDKTVDFAGSDAPMNEGEIKKAEAAGGPVVQIPTVAGAVVAAYNIPNFKGDLNLDGKVLADIYLGKIANWNDPAIAALNPGAALPNLAITAVHRSDGSGTNFVFTNYLCTQSPEFQTKVNFGKDVKWPGGQGAEKNAGVTQLVQSTAGAVGYVELNFAVEHNIPFAFLQNEAGKFVKASTDSVQAAGEGALKDMNEDKTMAVALWDRDGDGAYPICSFTYVIVYKDLGYLKDEAKAKALVDYLWWESHDEAGKIATDKTYAPLSAGVRAKAEEAIGSLTWGGKPVHPVEAK